MRIAIITENFLPKVDGVTRTIALLIEHLQSEGHQVLLLGPESGMTTYAGADIVGTWGIPLIGIYPELKLNFFRPLFLQKLRSFQPDVVHLVDPVWLGAQAAYMLEWLLPEVPRVSSYHTNLGLYCEHFGFDFLTTAMWRWNRHVHNMCALTYCPSESTATMLRKRGFNTVRIWSRGVDVGLFNPERRSETLRREWMGEGASHKAVLLYVGRVSYEKNLALVINAYKQMDHTRCHLVIVGHGPAFEDVKRDLSEYPVTFTGYLRGTQLAESFASADLFAFPSFTETFGQVVLEAMASGLPVVGLYAEGVCDLVTHTKTGLLLDVEGLTREEQTAQYRDLLVQMVNLGEKRRAMSQLAVAQAQKRTWHEAMETMVRAYREVALDPQQHRKDSVMGDDEDEDLFEEASMSEEGVTDVSETSSPRILSTHFNSLGGLQ
ncbi:uncharacterized protein VTP21DRAFT_3027 [Calcarisporiella thermophila]|uniref:uncharacterized protein n=1 Tax=Calcarisporiella thermophila TaxID=911321 RepID=UPI003742F8E0